MDYPQKIICPACKHLRRKCPPDCYFASHFPTHRYLDFLLIRKCYGINKMKLLTEKIKPDLRQTAIETLIFESKARVDFPVTGCLGIISELLRQIQQTKGELKLVRNELSTRHALMATGIIQEQQLSSLCAGDVFPKIEDVFYSYDVQSSREPQEHNQAGHGSLSGFSMEQSGTKYYVQELQCSYAVDDQFQGIENSGSSGNIAVQSSQDRSEEQNHGNVGDHLNLSGSMEPQSSQEPQEYNQAQQGSLSGLSMEQSGPKYYVQEPQCSYADDDQFQRIENSGSSGNIAVQSSQDRSEEQNHGNVGDHLNLSGSVEPQSSQEPQEHNQAGHGSLSGFSMEQSGTKYYVQESQCSYADDSQFQGTENSGYSGNIAVLSSQDQSEEQNHGNVSDHLNLSGSMDPQHSWNLVDSTMNYPRYLQELPQEENLYTEIERLGWVDLELQQGNELLPEIESLGSPSCVDSTTNHVQQQSQESQEQNRVGHGDGGRPSSSGSMEQGDQNVQQQQTRGM